MLAYTYQAENLCARCAVSNLARYAYANGTIPADLAGRAALVALDLANLTRDWQVDAVADAILADLAQALEIQDYMDSRTFDSGDFPKAFDADDSEACASCDRLLDSLEPNREPFDLARAEGAQTLAENVMRELSDAFQEESVMARAFDVAPTWERAESIATRITSAYLDAARQGETCPDDMPRVSYVGMEF